VRRNKFVCCHCHFWWTGRKNLNNLWFVARRDFYARISKVLRAGLAIKQNQQESVTVST
jgi:hypothetical protein